MDLIESKFINDPIKPIEKLLLNYNFLPITHSDLLRLETNFVEPSKIF